MWVIYQESSTSLNTIKGYVAILNKIDPDQVPGLPENYRDMLQKIDNAQNAISTLLNTLALPEGKGGWTTEE
jgi:hypothetical protein